MARTERAVRQSVSIPAGIARRVRTLAQAKKISVNRVLVDLIEAGLESKETEKERFFSLVSRLTDASDAAERERLKEELARMTFGGICGEGEFPKTFLLRGQAAKGKAL